MTKFSKKFRNHMASQTDKVVEQAVTNVGARFMNCLKPKPRFFPKPLWNWLIKTYVFDLERFKMETTDAKTQDNGQR